jgi:hypothetical protein
MTYRERARVSARAKFKEEMTDLLQVICCLLGFWGFTYAAYLYVQAQAYYSSDAWDG